MSRAKSWYSGAFPRRKDKHEPPPIKEAVPKHIKKVPKPWVLEVTIKWPEDEEFMSGRTSVFKHKYATEKAAKQAQPHHYEYWARFKKLTVTHKIYKKT